MVYRPALRVLLGGLLVSSLSSCQLVVDIDIRQLDDGRIVIATKDGSDHPPCISSLTIYRIVPGASEFDYPIEWIATNADGVENARHCTNRIVYPEIPPHYYGGPGKKLQPGQEYIVDADGAGFTTRTKIVRRAIR